MKKHAMIFIAIFSMVYAALPSGMATGQDLPVVKGKKIVASVNGEPITLEELTQEAAPMKAGGVPGEKVNNTNALEILKRMINTRLMVQEARNIGLDTLPETRMMVDAFSKEALREELAQKIIRDVKADEKEVERIYKETIQEWKISVILFEKEEDARAMEMGLQAGKDFSESAKTFIAEGKAKRGEEGVYSKVIDVDPQFARILSTMVVGSTSPPVQTKSGLVIMRLEDTRYNDNPKEKEKARQAALISARREALKAYEDNLRKKYVRINRDVLNSIDYDSEKPGFDALLKDKRVVAEIKGDKPITVGEMTEQMKYQLFHGVERSAERKRFNARKDGVLDGLVHRKLFRREALKQGLDRTESYRNIVKRYEISILFGMFINKVVVPDLKVTEDEVRAYYKDHMKEYTTPEMMRIRSLVFMKREDAESAIEKLHEGAEFQWLAAHAEGQAEMNAKGVVSFDDRLIMKDDLPEGIQKAIAGAKAGDSRLYASAEGYVYVLAIQDVAPSKLRPYEQVKEEVAKRLFDEKVNKAVEDYGDKLRSVSDVKVYLKG